GDLVTPTVDFGGRRDQHGLPGARSELEDDCGPVKIDLDRPGRVFDDEGHSHRCREVIHEIRGVDEPGHQLAVGHGSAHEIELRPDTQRGDVLSGDGREVVDDRHPVAAIEQVFHEVRAYEACAARDEHVHFCL